MLGSGASEFTAARAGNDLFVYTGMVDAGDQIWGFDTRAGDTDGIDLRALFDNIGYSALTPRLNGFMSVTQGATPTDTVISIDTNGGGDSFSVLLTLHGVTPATPDGQLFPVPIAERGCACREHRARANPELRQNSASALRKLSGVPMSRW